MNNKINSQNDIRNATIKDVAKLADVSSSTVSRYINGYNLRKEKRDKIRYAIKKLSYKENIMAKAVRSGKSMTVGFLVSSYKESFQTSILYRFELILEYNNYGVLVSDYGGWNERLLAKLDFFKDRMIDGIVLFSYKFDEKVINKLIELNSCGIPVIIINEDVQGLNTDKILSDNINSCFRTVEYLIHSKHTIIGVIIGNMDQNVSLERLEGYKECLEVYKIPIKEEYIKYGFYSRQGGYDATKELLTMETPPTAIFATSSHMSYGALMAIKDMGLKIPQDISIIGYDYSDTSNLMAPVLTFVEQPTERIGEAAAEVLFERMKGNRDDFPKTFRIPPKLIINESVRELK